MDSSLTYDGSVALSSQDLSRGLRDARQKGVSYRVPYTAETILRDAEYQPETIHELVPLTAYANFEVSICSDIGTRAMQEDRFTFCPQLIPGRYDTAFFGVFDGTVGDFASDNVQRLVVPHLIGSPPWRRIVRLLTAEKAFSRPAQLDPTGIVPPTASEPPSHFVTAERNSVSCESLGPLNSWNDGQGSHDTATPPVDSNEEQCLMKKAVSQTQIDEELPLLLWASVQWMYLNADAELVQRCHESERHYASSTAVTVLLMGQYCCVAHLGDSRVALGYERDGMLYGEFLTADHKPNLRLERDRILRHGGSVEYLHNHNSKPFIRGGDFAARKARGEQPMQLQYSRAFGGKDLKMFGLSNEPDIRIFPLNPQHRVLVLASDGVWDVQTAAKAVELVLLARRTGENPARFLIQATLGQQELHNQNVDNLTVIVVFLEGTCCVESWHHADTSASCRPSGALRTVKGG